MWQGSLDPDRSPQPAPRPLIPVRDLTAWLLSLWAASGREPLSPGWQRVDWPSPRVVVVVVVGRSPSSRTVGNTHPGTGVPRAPHQHDRGRAHGRAVGSVGRPPPGSAGSSEAPCPQAAGLGNNVFTVPRVLLPQRMGGLSLFVLGGGKKRRKNPWDTNCHFPRPAPSPLTRSPLN